MKKVLFSIFIALIFSSVGYSQGFRPGDNELLFMPTAYTMPKGNSYFSDYELFFLNYSYAVTSTTHLSVFSLFPVTPMFYETLTLGVKQKAVSYKTVQSAFYGIFSPKLNSLTIGNVISVGQPSQSLHASFAFLSSSNSKTELVYLIGVRMDPSENTSLIFEYGNTHELIQDDFVGLVSLGIRIRSEHMSWEIAGVRPLAEDTNDLLILPLLKVGYYFN